MPYGIHSSRLALKSPSPTVCLQPPVACTSSLFLFGNCMGIPVSGAGNPMPRGNPNAESWMTSNRLLVSAKTANPLIVRMSVVGTWSLRTGKKFLLSLVSWPGQKLATSCATGGPNHLCLSSWLGCCLLRELKSVVSPLSNVFCSLIIKTLVSKFLKFWPNQSGSCETLVLALASWSSWSMSCPNTTSSLTSFR